MGVMEVRRGVGKFLADGAGRWGDSPFQMLGALHGVQLQQMAETRLILEGAAAALAAKRATEEHLRMLAEEVAEMYSAVDCAEQFMAHEMRFHRAIAAMRRAASAAEIWRKLPCLLYGGKLIF
jgi:DNA-binding FadR family transcriptional regulator